jgi:hypothetical protein
MKLPSNRIWYIVVVVFLVGVRAPSASAQVVPSAPEAPREEPKSTLFYTLNRVKADAVAETLKELFADAKDQVSIGVDEASNSLIVSTTVDKAKEIEALLQQLDSPELPREAEQLGRDIPLQVYHLKYAQAQEAADVVSHVMMDAGLLQIAVDARTNTLLIRAPEAQLRVIAQILEVLDTPERRGSPEPAEASTGQQRRLVLYWLASGPDFETNKLVPSHLEPVVEELEGMGIQNVQLVSRSVAALDGGSVSLRSTVSAGNYRSLDLVVEGLLTSKREDTPRLDLNVRATHADDVSHVETTITAPYDHFVVLGTSGLGALENAFVIQIQSVAPARKESGQRQ